MVRKIIFSGIFLCLCIAVPLALMGYTHVSLGAPFMALMSNVNRDLSNFKVEIPNIPLIPHYEGASSTTDALQFLSAILNGLINFVNMFVYIINALTGVINVIIQLIEFIFLLIKNLISFKDSLQQTSAPSLPII